jgi:hypothetical protein
MNYFLQTDERIISPLFVSKICNTFMKLLLIAAVHLEMGILQAGYVQALLFG